MHTLSLHDALPISIIVDLVLLLQVLNTILDGLVCLLGRDLASERWGSN